MLAVFFVITTQLPHKMPTVVLRISKLYSLFNSILHYFFPKKLRSFFFINTLAAIEPKKPQSFLSPSPSSSSSSSSPASTSSSPAFSSTEKQHMDGVELKRMFQMFDHNGDSRITKKELKESLEKLGISVSDEDLDEMIEKIDVNGDGCVDMEEFETLYKTIVEDGRDGEEEEEDMKEAFNVFDQNGDGFISGEELKEVLCSLGMKQGKTVEDCRKMIRMVDVDGDGMVNYKEFKQMMRSGRTGFAA